MGTTTGLGKKKIEEWITELSTIEDLTNYVSIKNFGAEGDGETNDRQAIIDAVNYAVENDKEIIYFPNGTYAIDEKLIFNSEVSHMTFLGDNATIKPLNTDVSRLLEIKATTNDIEKLTIKGFVFDGDRQNLDDVEHGDTRGLHLWGDTGLGDSRIIDSKILDCEFKNLSQSGFEVGVNTRNIIVNNIITHHNRMHGFSTREPCKNIIFNNILSYQNYNPDDTTTGSGFDIHGGDEILINNFIISGCGYGFKTSTGSPDVSFTNGIIEDSNSRGFYMTGKAKNIYMDNLTFLDNPGSAIEFRHGVEKNIHCGLIKCFNNKTEDWGTSAGVIFIEDDEDFDDSISFEKVIIDGSPEDMGVRAYNDGIKFEYLEVKNINDSYAVDLSGDKQKILGGSFGDNWTYQIRFTGNKNIATHIDFEDGIAFRINGENNRFFFNDYEGTDGIYEDGLSENCISKYNWGE